MPTKTAPLPCSRKVFWTAPACFREQQARMSASQIPIQEQADVLVTEAKRKDVGFVDSFTLDPGLIVALDCGPHRLHQFSRWTIAGVNFGVDSMATPPDQVVNDCRFL
jgi:hypothetical protein